jgi:hypothetical protein
MRSLLMMRRLWFLALKCGSAKQKKSLLSLRFFKKKCGSAKQKESLLSLSKKLATHLILH